ncbi:MAG: HAD family hydrolase [Halobacteriaceae archaeon]
MYDAVIFDADGVLFHLSGSEIIERAARDAFADLGISEPPADHVETISRVPRDAVADGFAELREYHEIDADELLTRRDDRAVEHQVAAARTGRKEPYDDVDALEDLDIPLAVVSNNQQGTVDGVLETHGLSEYFEAIYGREHGLDGLRKKKPDPHYLERAAGEVGATNPLYVGDSGTDVLAAHEAGYDVVFVRRAHRAEYELPAAPTHEVGGLRELVDWIDPS